MNIEGISEKSIIQMYDILQIKSVADLYYLTNDDLYKLDGFKDKKVDNFFEQIEKRNRIIKESDLLEDECTIRINENLNEFETTYINAVKVDTIECLKKSKYEEMGKKLLESERTISEKDAKIADLTAKVEKLESKEKRRGKYEKRVKNHISKPKKKNKKKRR